MAAKKKIRGAQAYQRDETVAAMVRLAALHGARQDVIARSVGIDPKTLRKYYREELTDGAQESLTRIAVGVGQMALRVGPGCAPEELRAAMFLLNTKGGYSRKTAPDDEGKAGVQISGGLPDGHAAMSPPEPREVNGVKSFELEEGLKVRKPDDAPTSE